MRKALFLSLVVAVLAFVGIAIAADKIGTMGSPNASGTYAVEAFDDRSIVVASDATFTVSSSAKVGAPTIGGVVGTNYLAVKDGVEIDGSLYTDGSIYNSVVTEVYALCFTGGAPGASGYLGHCTTTPTNGACTCVKN